ncbi:hypothetical protein P4571_12730 [Niallia alba]|uniref:hypothetical protein n=1 Tax=Niallia alba TaxID=2729105 RepID=UPI002E1ABEDB|nr:hypothetical protein [Niallia alba]
MEVKKELGNSFKAENIGNEQKYVRIAVTWAVKREKLIVVVLISAKEKRKSAKLGIYQPKRRGNQPTHKYISQREEEISQPKKSPHNQKNTKKAAKLDSHHQPLSFNTSV